MDSKGINYKGLDGSDYLFGIANKWLPFSLRPIEMAAYDFNILFFKGLFQRWFWAPGVKREFAHKGCPKLAFLGGNRTFPSVYRV